MPRPATRRQQRGPSASFGVAGRRPQPYLHPQPPPPHTHAPPAPYAPCPLPLPPGPTHRQQHAGPLGNEGQRRLQPQVHIHVGRGGEQPRSHCERGLARQSREEVRRGAGVPPAKSPARTPARTSLMRSRSSDGGVLPTPCRSAVSAARWGTARPSSSPSSPPDTHPPPRSSRTAPARAPHSPQSPPHGRLTPHDVATGHWRRDPRRSPQRQLRRGDVDERGLARAQRVDQLVTYGVRVALVQHWFSIGSALVQH